LLYAVEQYMQCLFVVWYQLQVSAASFVLHFSAI